MIIIKKFNKFYSIKYNGDKENFSLFLYSLMKIKGLDYNIDLSCWTIPISSFYKIKMLFKKEDIIEEENKEIIYDDNIGSTMKLKPYEYQKEAIEFILNTKETLLCLPCGAGKTAISIGAFLECKKHNIINKNAKGLIIVKSSLKYQWQSEVNKFSDLTAIVVKTPSEINTNISNKIKSRERKLEKEKDKNKIKELKKQLKELKKEYKDNFKNQFKGSHSLFIINYEALLNSEIFKELSKLEIDFVTSDESQYIKNRKSKRSKALYKFSNEKTVKIGATATPIQRDPEDLFGILKYINPKLFESWKSFSDSYVKYNSYGRISGIKNQYNLQKKISPHFFIKTKEDISNQLPKTICIQKECIMSDRQQSVYDTIMEELDSIKEKEFNLKKTDCKNKDEELEKIKALTFMYQTFAQEVTDCPLLLKESKSETAKRYYINEKGGKLELFIDIISELLSSGEKVAVFCKFVNMQKILSTEINAKFPKVKIAYLRGDMDAKQRDIEVYEKFRDTEDYKVIFLSDAGAEGLNFSTTRYLIEYDLAESYAIQKQRQGRLERADSIYKNVFIYQLICKNSWDDIALKIIQKKKDYDENIIKNLK